MQGQTNKHQMMRHNLILSLILHCKFIMFQEDLRKKFAHCDSDNTGLILKGWQNSFVSLSFYNFNFKHIYFVSLLWSIVLYEFFQRICGKLLVKVLVVQELYQRYLSEDEPSFESSFTLLHIDIFDWGHMGIHEDLKAL